MSGHAMDKRRSGGVVLIIALALISQARR